MLSRSDIWCFGIGVLCVIFAWAILRSYQFWLHSDEETLTNAHVYRLKTHHARLLPRESRHQFHYSTVDIGCDLDALEAHQLDLNRFFHYNSPRRAVFAFDSSSFSSPDVAMANAPTRVRRMLSDHGVAVEDMQKIYTVAMPTLFGWAGMNPLVVHHFYQLKPTSVFNESATVFKGVCLEVHNTFEERHIYVLKCDSNEDAKVVSGFVTLLHVARNSPSDKAGSYHHQWTFPRAFHVSPFNDRTGFYRVSLVDPLANVAKDSKPFYRIKVLFLNQSHSKHLVATHSGYGEPMSRRVILKAAVRHPIDLLSVTLRIAYNATILHYVKRLPVYDRPEPFVDRGEKVCNPVQEHSKAASILWQEPSRAQKIIGRAFETHVQSVIKRDPSSIGCISLESADKHQNKFELHGSGQSDACIFYMGSSFFEDIVLSRSPAEALTFASTHGNWRLACDQQQNTLQRLLLSSRATNLSLSKRCRKLVLKIYHYWRGHTRQPNESLWLNDISSWALTFAVCELVTMKMLASVAYKLANVKFAQS